MQPPGAKGISTSQNLCKGYSLLDSTSARVWGYCGDLAKSSQGVNVNVKGFMAEDARN